MTWRAPYFDLTSGLFVLQLVTGQPAPAPVIGLWPLASVDGPPSVKSGCCWIIWQAMHSWRAARQAISGSKQRGRPRAGWFEPLSRQKLDSLTSQEAAVSQDRFRQSYFR